MSVDLGRRLSSHRGPMHGEGRGNGRAWAGLVEKTPALWVSWLSTVCKDLQVDPRRLRLSFYGVPLALVSVPLTFGDRWYWLCPICHRRCEAVYYAGRVGCRCCLHLGYASQGYRRGSIWLYLDQIFSRSFAFRQGMSGRYDTDGARAIWGAVVKDLRGELRAELRRLVAAVTIEALPAPEAAAGGEQTQNEEG